MRSERFPAELRIAPVRREDLLAVAAIHRKAFAESAITAFGIEAVRRYYDWLLEGPHDAALVGAWSGPRLLGFCAAGAYLGAMNGFLRANRMYLARRIAAHPRLLLSPLIRERIQQALVITARFSRLSRRTKRVAEASSQVARFGVLSIATHPDGRGAGVGRALMLEAEARARAGGHDQMVLTVHPDNHGAIRFYEQLGWKRRNDDAGAWSGGMYKDLTSAPVT